jgi:hypothetical protein
MPLTESERDRLISLIRHHRLEPIEDILLAHTEPCITLMLKEIRSRGDDGGPPRPGASRMGGMPDLPEGFAWPRFRCQYDNAEVYSGFLMQIDLAEMPAIENSPLPATGLLSIFHRDQCAEFSESFEAYLFPESGNQLRTTSPPPDLRCASEAGVCLDDTAYLIDGVLGLDAPDKGQDDVMRNLCAERFGHETLDLDDPQWWAARLAAFQMQAIDPDHEARIESGFPQSWWRVGQLLGRMDYGSAAFVALHDRGDQGRLQDYQYRAQHSEALTREAATRWRLLLQLETNPIVDFAGGCDTAPVLILAQDEGARPWSSIGQIRASLAP